MSIGIWNNIDELALYLGLSRLDGETNDEFVNRIKIFPRWKYRTDYYTQVHSIPLQLGLNTDVVGRITSKNGNKYECDIAWDYLTIKEILPVGSLPDAPYEYIRIFLEGKFDTLQSVVNVINNSKNFKIDIYNTDYLTSKLSFLVRNNSIKIDKTLTSGKYSSLGFKDLVEGSVRINDPSYRRLVSSANLLKRPGEYYIDYVNGFIQTYDPSPAKTTVLFRYYDPSFALEITELNLVPINRIFAYGLSDDSINMIPYLLNNIVAGE